MAKQKNIDIWNGYMRLINEREKTFIDSIIGEKKPEIIYQVYLGGNLTECFVTDINYTNGLYLSKKSPTKEDIQTIKNYYDGDPLMTPDKIAFEYYYLWGDNNERKASSTHYLYRKDNYCKLTLSKEEAILVSEELIKKNKEEQEWRELHKKDASYNYNENGYKFLGWQNSWNHVYFDAEGNQTDDPSKRVAFGYTKEDYPEYGNCRELKHRTIDVSHNNRGSEHTVSCPECKIYWKYDSSD